MTKEIKKTITRHKKWLEQNGDRLYLRDRVSLEADLKVGQIKSLPHIPRSLNTLGIFHGIRGVVRLVGGEASGWDDIAAAIGYHAWSIVFQTETYLKQNCLGLRVTGVTNYAPLIACVAATSSKWELQMLNLLERLSADQQHSTFAKRPAKQFEDFVQMLLSWKLRGEKPQLEIEEGFYIQILLSWDDDTRLSSAITKSLDYHCTRIDQKTTEEFAPEFRYAPFDLLPCEWMLVHRVRDSQGISTPTTKHQLLSTLSAAPVDIIDNIDDGIESLLIDVYAKYLC